MNTAEEFKVQGNAAQQAGKFDEAIDFYTQAIALDASNHVYYSNRSAAYLSKDDAKSALEDAEKCIQVKPDWPKAYTRKGASLHALKRYDEAVKAYETGIAIAPNDDGLKRGLQEVKKAITAAENSSRPGFNNPFGGNILARLAGNPKFASYLADPVFCQRVMTMQNDPSNMTSLQEDPRMMEVLGFLLGINLSDRDEGEVEDVPASGFEEMKSEPVKQTTPPKTATPAAHTKDGVSSENQKALEAKLRGNKYYSAKEFDKALESYIEAANLDPTNMTFLLNQAAVKMEQKDWEACESLCQDAISVGRSNRASYEDIAKAYVRSGKAAAKRGDYEKCIEQLKSAQVEHYTKETEKLLKNTELEYRKAQAAAYIDHDKALAAKEKGNEFFRAGSWVEAIKEYEEAIKRDPSNAIYRNNLASTLVKIMDFNGAKAAVEKALELDPNYVKAWAKKGDIEFVMKEYHKALETYQKGLSLEPDNSLCKQGLQKTVAKIHAPSGTNEEEKERRAHAMSDPAIQAILSDPVVQQVLQDLQQNPMEGQKALKDPIMRVKIEKLIAAGILQMR